MAVSIRESYSKRLKRKTYAYDIDTVLQKNRVREVKRGFNTRTEAREAGRLRELQLKKKSKQGYDINDIISKDKSKITVAELLDLWIVTKKANVSSKSYSFYEFVTKMVKNKLGKIKAINLKTENIELAVNELIENNISSTTARHFYTVLNIACRWAIKRGYLIKNPCELMAAPKKAKNEIHTLDEIQLNKLLEAIKDQTIYGPVVIAATTGMREAEICGLTWENVNLDDGFIEVKQQLQEVNNNLELVPLKTAKSQRKIVLLDYTIEVLKELQQKQEYNKNYLGDKYNDLGFVICQNNGYPYNPIYISRNFRRILKEAKHKVTIDGKVKKMRLYEMLDIPIIRFHDLRHTHATLLLKANVNPKIVSERLGHADIRTTLNLYSHVLPDIQQAAVNELNKMFPIK